MGHTFTMLKFTVIALLVFYTVGVYGQWPEECQSDSDCFGDYCCGGECMSWPCYAEPEAQKQPLGCFSDGDCMRGYSCCGGFCKRGPCAQPQKQPLGCFSDGDCMRGYSCCGGFCKRGPCAQPQKQP